MSDVTSEFTFSYLKNGGWNNFNGTVQSGMDGIKVQKTGGDYYLQYRTLNQGK